MVEPGLYRASSGPDPAVTEPRAGGPDQYRAPSGPDFFSQGPNGPNFRQFELLYKGHCWAWAYFMQLDYQIKLVSESFLIGPFELRYED